MFECVYVCVCVCMCVCVFVCVCVSLSVIRCNNTVYTYGEQADGVRPRKIE